jgi:hypothetical protein
MTVQNNFYNINQSFSEFNNNNILNNTSNNSNDFLFNDKMKMKLNNSFGSFSNSIPSTTVKSASSIYNENFEQSLQKGFRDIINIYNNSNYKPYFSLQCNYYCNLNTKNDNNYYINQYEKMLENLAKKIDGNLNSNLGQFNENNETNTKEV